MPAKLRLHVAAATLVPLAVILAVGATGVVALSGAEAANQPSCGDTITTDTTLQKDLVNCPTNGIVIGADNVTLDLNGHTIDGDGTIQSCGPRCHLGGPGVSFINHDGITVKDGSIRQFVDGLDAVGTRDVRLLGLHTSRNRFFGIDLAAADRVLVRNCSADRTTARERHSEGTGLFVGGAAGPALGGRDGRSHHVRIVNSSFRHNAGDGIRSLVTTDSVIKGNLISDNRATGIDWGSSRDRLIGNRIVRNGTGIVVNGAHDVIARNRISKSSRHGENYGVHVGGGHDNVVAGNVIAGGNDGIHISGGGEPGRIGAVDTVVRGNRVRGANHDGVQVVLTAKHTLLENNSASDSRDDGFDVNDPTTKLSRNRADRNGDLGIEAVPGVNDGGGNIARHNGDPRQCTNIVCN